LTESHHINDDSHQEANAVKQRPDRRRFLLGLMRGTLMAAAVLVVDQIARFLSFQPASGNVSVFAVGQPSDYPRGALSYVPEARAYVGHDVGGLYVVDAACTHLVCLVELDHDGNFLCPCHDSSFGADGRALAGPATRALRHLHLWLNEDGQLMVDRAKSEQPTTRLTRTSLGSFLMNTHKLG
jgi:Rieske Fe-S protein